MKKFIVALLFLHSCFLGVYANGEADKGILQAGASKVTITPPEEVYSSQYSGIHDSLYVRTIVLDNGFTKVALVSMEIVGVPKGEEFVNSLAKNTGIDVENIYLSATHDHNSMFMYNSDAPEGKVYYEKILKATEQSIDMATKALQPARIGYAEGKAYVNTNREEKIGDGYHMGYVPDGPSDKTVSVISITSVSSGEPIAIYSNYAVHSVVMYKSITKDGKPEVSGDLAGFTSRYVEDHFPGAVALWTSGAAGDQAPLLKSYYNQDAPDVYDEGAAGYAIVDVLSRRLGEEIVRKVKSIKNVSSDVVLWSKKTTVSCPGRKRKYPRDPNVPTGGYLAPTTIEYVDGEPVEIPLHLLMINDIAFAGVSAEVFTEIGIHLKQQSIFDRTLMVTNLPGGIGYVPTDAAYLLPSEKALSSRIKPGCAESAIINGFLLMMDEYLDNRIQ